MADLTEARFAAKSVEYETPLSVFAPLDAEFHFTLDVCATAANKKVSAFYSQAENSLLQAWRGVCWCNPPYGRDLPLWVKKAYHTAQHGYGTVVMLLPARTNTAWWHQYCLRGEIRFLKGRPKFNNGKHGLPFPLAVVIFRAHSQQPQVLRLHSEGQLGAVG